jgi:hypothetical protein
MDLYKGKKRHEVPPHVFAITDNAYRSMLQGEYYVFWMLFSLHSTLHYVTLHIYFICELLGSDEYYVHMYVCLYMVTNKV